MSRSEVSQDYFLFSCFEFEKTCKAIPHTLASNRRWPLGRSLEENLDATHLESTEWAKHINALLNWYQETYPKITEVDVITDENLVEVLEPLVYMSMDIRLLAQKIMNAPLPSFEKAELAPEPWQIIFSTIEKAIPGLTRYFKQFMWWSYQEEVVVEEDEERPPTGRHGPPRRSAAPSRSAPSRTERDERPRRDDKRNQKDRKPQRGDRGRERDHRPAGGPRRDVSLTNEQMDEIKAAVEQLRENSDLSEINLAPANSFHRHLQHSQIKDEGFFSRSEGHDKNRFVVVTRENTRPDAGE